MQQLITLLGLIFFSWPNFQEAPPKVGTLAITVENIEKAKGKMMVAVYKGAEDFLKDGSEVATKAVLVENVKPLQLNFDNLPFGEYSVAVYHDWNDNNKLDTNMFGIPNEPYGFSNNARSKWGPPEYEIARFQLEDPALEMVIRVKKWSKQ